MSKRLTLVLLTGVLCGAVLLGGGAAWARYVERPILANEIRDWCGLEGDIFAETECDDASFSMLPDGSLRVVFNYDPSDGRLEGTGCVEGLAIPEGVTGWAYVLAPVATPTSATPIPYPTPYASSVADIRREKEEAQETAIAAYWDQFEPDRRVVLSITEARLLPDVAYCELVIAPQ